ncbi:MAG TPA: PqqD family peptide modification chaperone [Thermoanaerobaculia bacterium]|nr:PqqD family peptide modification chaperone [Thermoanaerobaculia bacterium]
MKITPASVVVASKEQLSTPHGDEVVIAGLRKGNYYALDAVGARVWELVQTPVAVSGLTQRIVEEFDVTVERCEADLLALLESMAEQGLLEVR